MVATVNHICTKKTEISTTKEDINSGDFDTNLLMNFLQGATVLQVEIKYGYQPGLLAGPSGSSWLPVAVLLSQDFLFEVKCGCPVLSPCFITKDSCRRNVYSFLTY
ncbi:hypothetical protein EVAR_68503_1 [Eumeta japonica]|uniref:Uncharacterized protein n=1 Tax=Eumeta variegata TaxID=151549 RepID=A0A4C2A713_EUMVA|nr:hypothetical protein EVAR_68503_1 [Eumeta japonica]